MSALRVKGADIEADGSVLRSEAAQEIVGEEVSECRAPSGLGVLSDRDGGDESGGGDEVGHGGGELEIQTTLDKEVVVGFRGEVAAWNWQVVLENKQR